MKNFIVRNSFSFAFMGLIVLFSVICLLKYSIDDSSNYMEVTVVGGDSLWKIAAKYNDDRMETAEFISELKKVNNMNEDILQAGDVIMVPVKERHEKHLTMNK